MRHPILFFWNFSKDLSFKYIVVILIRVTGTKVIRIARDPSV